MRRRNILLKKRCFQATVKCLQKHVLLEDKSESMSKESTIASQYCLMPFPGVLKAFYSF